MGFSDSAYPLVKFWSKVESGEKEGVLPIHMKSGSALVPYRESEALLMYSCCGTSFESFVVSDVSEWCDWLMSLMYWQWWLLTCLIDVLWLVVSNMADWCDWCIETGGFWYYWLMWLMYWRWWFLMCLIDVINVLRLVVSAMTDWGH